MLRIKLYLYWFLSKFFKFYKEKYQKMAVQNITDDLVNIFSYFGYSSLQKSDKAISSGQYEIILVIALKTHPYSLRLRISYNNPALHYYRLVFTLVGTTLEQDESTYDASTLELSTIDGYLKSLKPQLMYQFSLLP